VKNPTAVTRENESVVVDAASLGAVDLAQVRVVDETGNALLAQKLSLGEDQPTELLFQVTIPANSEKKFSLSLGATPPDASAYQVYGRFVRERLDDFAWENDLLASRMYGPALETAGKETLISSGVDAWVKRTPKLVLNNWYLSGNYHADHGEGGDFYSVGKSRGCGGTGIWEKGKLYSSKNFTVSRVLANGPIRLVFELDYAPWRTPGGANFGETKRITLDAHSSFNRIESRFQIKGTPPSYALGIAKHPGATASYNLKSGWLQTWEPLNEKNGNLGCAVAIPGAKDLAEAQTETDNLLTTPLSKEAKLTYYTGHVWDGNGRITDSASWDSALAALVERSAQPLSVSVTATP
jgi:hypothetical protein